MTFFYEHIVTDNLILSFGTYLPFIEIINDPQLLIPYGFEEDFHELELDENFESMSKAIVYHPILEKIEVGTIGNHGIDHVDLKKFLDIDPIWRFSKKHNLIFLRLYERHKAFLKNAVEKFRSCQDPRQMFEKMSFSMMNQPCLDEFFTELGFKKGKKVNKFEEVREDGWKLEIYISSKIEFYVKPPGVD